MLNVECLENHDFYLPNTVIMTYSVALSSAYFSDQDS